MFMRSERSESKDLNLLFGKLTFNRAPPKNDHALA